MLHRLLTDLHWRGAALRDRLAGRPVPRVPKAASGSRNDPTANDVPGLFSLKPARLLLIASLGIACLMGAALGIQTMIGGESGKGVRAERALIPPRSTGPAQPWYQGRPSVPALVMSEPSVPTDREPEQDRQSSSEASGPEIDASPGTKIPGTAIKEIATTGTALAETAATTTAPPIVYEEPLPADVRQPLPLLTVKVSISNLPKEDEIPATEERELAALIPDVPPSPDLPRPEASPLITPSPNETVSSLPDWRANAVAVNPADKRPMIAIVIDDLGLDRTRTARTVELPGPLTLSFLTYAEDLASQTAKARNAGHELLVHVPMEPQSRTIDPGPEALTLDLPEEEWRRRLDWGLGRFDGYVGFNNHMGSRFTADRHAMRVVLEEAEKRGLMFLDSRTSGGAVGPAIAQGLGLPWAERHVFLDHVNDVSTVAGQLAELEQLAREHGYAVAIGHPRDATLSVLETWLVEAQARFQLVPISHIAWLKAEALGSDAIVGLTGGSGND
ncbi:MAG: divergent polysaccharide deacetylase family protein [Magnetovibrionaceae bacterium]